MKKLLALLLAVFLLAACTPVEKLIKIETRLIAADALAQETSAPAGEPVDPTAEPVEPAGEPAEDYSESWRERPIPETFDLRSVDTDGDGVGDRCFVPPVRNQRPFGSCWGFAATGAAEISILGSILKHDPDAWKTINLSEKQMIFYSHTPLSDPTNPQNGEGLIPAGMDAQSLYGTGGQPFLAATTYAQGIGPSNETSEEYGDLFAYHGNEKTVVRHYYDGAFNNSCYSDTDDWTIPEEYRFRRDYYLEEAVILPSPAKVGQLGDYDYHPEYNALIKEQLLEKRGVSIGFFADVSRPDQALDEIGVYLNNRTWAHYTWDGNVIANHAVVIIGWDDNYPKENFLEGHQPPENGAWLVRNSWGSGECEFPDHSDGDWGIEVQKTDENGEPVFDENGAPVMVHSGYFWLSYFDMSIVNPESFIFTDSIAPEYVDQHDYLQVSEIQCKTFDTPVKMANVFTAKHSQILTDISCMTTGLNTTAAYEIYLLSKDFTTPDEGLLAASGTVSFAYGGYHKIALDEGVVLQKGQPYSIILTVTDKDGRYAYNESAAYQMGNVFNTRAVINPKESFLYRNGGWEDYQKVAEEDIQAAKTLYNGVGVWFDNFPLKGYSNRITGDVSMMFGITSEEMTLIEGYNTTKVSLQFEAPEYVTIGSPEIEWTLLNGSEALVDLVLQKDGTQVKLTAKRSGTVYLSARVKDQDSLGTAILRLEVLPVAPAKAMTLNNYNTYTGEPITPIFSVRTSLNIVLTEGVDYTVEYSNNILCGTGEAVFTAIQKNPDEPVPAPIKATFVIIPPKAEITEAEGADHSIRLAFTDFWPIGVSGVDVEYRKVGAVDWITEKVAEGAAEHTIGGLDGGVTYEVRIRAYATAISMLQIESDFYGEYSDVLTVAVP